MAPHKLLSDVCNKHWAFLLTVSMTTTMTCLAPPKEGGRQTLSFSLRQNAFSPICSYSITGNHNNTQLFSPQLALFSKTVNSYHCRFARTVAKYVLREPYEILLSFCLLSKLQATVWDLSRSFVLCFHIFICGERQRCKFCFFWCLTIAITAAPAPARAQMNRWKVMSSCSKNKTQHTLFFKAQRTSLPIVTIPEF